MSEFREAMRRIITGDDASGQSVIILDGPPSAFGGDPDLGGLFEIWEDSVSAPLDPKDHADQGGSTAVLGPRPGNVQVRWFVVAPQPEGVPKPELDAMTREIFGQFGGARHGELGQDHGSHL
ncbi:MAG: hypothetical protein ACNA7W_18850, partial [Pseudomonadales bacterium]